MALRREMIDVGAVDCRVLGERILYLGVGRLSATAAAHVQAAARVVGQPARLVVLDLRGNEGGLLAAAVDLADTFLQSGPILSIEGRGAGATRRHVATSGTSALEQARLAVLVDGETGSGAEAVAAAVQDNRRGMVLGAPTAARAHVQTLCEVAGGALRLRTANLMRASGEALDGRGVTPHVVIAADSSPPAAPLADAACSGLASPGRVSSDPVVARAAQHLLSPWPPGAAPVEASRPVSLYSGPGCITLRA